MKKVLIIISAIFLICILLLIVKNSKEKPFNKIPIPSNGNIVLNTTNQKFADTILYTTLDRCSVSNTVVVLKYKENADNKAYIIGSDKSYVIYMTDLSKDEAIEVLSHETIHLTQYQSNRLIKYPNGIMFDNNLYTDWEQIDYSIRPWESEAFRKQDTLISSVRNILY